MKVRNLVIKEILYRKVSFVLGLISVVAAVGALVGSFTLLNIHDLRTGEILEHKQAETARHMARLKDDMRKATLKLGLNLLILPKDQKLGDWYAKDYGSKYMPLEYVDKLANSGVVTVRHFLPILQQKVKWPETKRTVILVGTKGEVSNLHKSPKEPLVQPVPKDTMVLGYELHQSLALKVGDKVKFMGKEFNISRLAQEKGGKDDITLWINLAQAQQMLDKKDKINAIVALHCLCLGRDLSKMRSEMMAVLPETQVVEIGTEKALTRAEARMAVGREAKAALEREKQMRAYLRGERENLASILTVVVMLAAGIWIGFLAFGNVRQRTSEIGILRAVGFRSNQILLLFLSKAIVIGFFGGLLGSVIGFYLGGFIGAGIEQVSMQTVRFATVFEMKLFVLAIVLATLLSAIASWIPSLIAARQDPARILSKE